LNPDYAEILSALFAENAEFLVVGAFALAAHGAPRTTGDIDLWVNPDPANARRVWQALLKFGAPLSGFSPDDFSKPDVVFQMGVPPVRIDLLTSIDGVEWNEAWAGRLVKEVEGVRVPVLSSEHMIRNKRATGRPQDLVDADILERRLSKHKKS
jgi:hypothetical protein